MSEMNKLIKLLAKNDIPFEVRSINILPYGEDYPGSTIQICSPSDKNIWVDAICHRGSYGGKEGLIEIMGIFEEDDGVIGHLTAEQAYGYFVKVRDNL